MADINEIVAKLNYRKKLFKKEIVITGVKDKSITEIVIPAEIDGMAVTGIGNYAFYGCENLTSVEINSVKKIGGDAFWGCESLTNVEMNNVKKIDVSAFSNCTSLTSVEMNNVKKIGKCAFLGCPVVWGKKGNSAGNTADDKKPKARSTK